MRMRLCFALVLLGVGSLACSSKSTKPKANDPTQTSTYTNTNTNTDAGDPDAGGADVNGNCPVWPAEKLAPMIGPFFYGTDPRPCRVDIGSVHLFYTWDDNPRVTQMRNVIANEATTYEYDDNGFIVSSYKTNSKGTTTTTYEYGSDSTTWATTDVTGAVSKTVYELDKQGYPMDATISPAPADQPARYVHFYENCRLTKRVAYKADNSVDDDLTAEYAYDDQGRVAERNAPLDVEVIVYYDADGNCPPP